MWNTSLLAEKILSRYVLVEGSNKIWPYTLRVCSSIIINCVSPLSFVGLLGVIFIFYLIFGEISLCKQNSPTWDAVFCGVTSGAMLFAYVPLKEHQA